MDNSIYAIMYLPSRDNRVLKYRNEELKAEIERLQAALATAVNQARIVADLLDIGDQRLLVSDGPAGNQKPDLSPSEWGKVYRACKRLAALAPSPSAPKEDR